MPDREWFEARLETIRQQKLKLLADYNATCGAEQLCQQVIDSYTQTTAPVVVVEQKD